MNTGDSILTLISEGWHMILTFIAFIIGYTKLHVKATQNEEKHRETRNMLSKVDEEAKASMHEMEERINKRRAEDLERVENVMKEVRIDIKTLLQRH